MNETHQCSEFVLKDTALFFSYVLELPVFPPCEKSYFNAKVILSEPAQDLIEE